jgi:RecG-like helicase
MGTQQSGVLPFLIANLKKDVDILKTVRHAVDALLQEDPSLSLKNNGNIRLALSLTQQGKSIWKYIG